MRKFQTKEPQTLQDAILYYTNELRCVEFLSQMKWKSTGGERCCPKCGSTNIVGMRTRPTFLCKEKGCKKQFSIKVGTVMECSKLPITKWVPAIWLIVNNKNGISSYELGRAIGVRQDTAWFMLHRIREAVSNGSLEKLSGTVEIDETFVGGLSKNMHKDKRQEKIKNTGGKSGNKTTVFGIIERGGEVRAKVIPNTMIETLYPEIIKNVKSDANVYTDSYKSYWRLHELFGNHKMIDHEAKVYVDGNVWTNGIENFWSLLKRSVKGTYIQISPKHLNSYVIEQAFRFNTRKETDAQRFERAVGHIFGKRLKYKDLIARDKNVHVPEPQKSYQKVSDDIFPF
jgi:transposase-like protein